MLLLVLTACSATPPLNKGQATVELDIIQSLKDKKTPQLTYNDIRPILERRCIVCHGCFDAPCQLKLSSMEGITRGANKLKVYNKKRTAWQQPSRLFIDAKTTDEWRDMEFFSVLNESELKKPVDNLDNSVLYKMLRLKQLNPLPRVGMLPEDLDVSLDRKQVCTRLDNFYKFAKDHPLWGMPYALPNLSDKDYKLLTQWLAQGAKASEIKRPSTETLPQIERWEAFFNGEGNKQQLVSRYIYEHLVLGHIHFKGAPESEFFRLVRSRTKPGEPIDEIASIRPYDDPEGGFSYRLRPYTASIVDKDHIVYEFSDARMERYKELFLQPAYDVEELPGYNPGEASNFFERFFIKLRKLFGLYKQHMLTPFKVFAAIPPKARYQFLLDDARFFINGFIKGPVCRGQSALSSIEDHFWVFFLKPENPPGHQQHGLDQKFLAAMDEYLHLPTELADTSRLFTAWIRYWPQEQKYMQAKLDYYKDLPKFPIREALDKFVWNGIGDDDTPNRNATLTVFRHFDSASVHYGLLGDEPETAWIIDYPVFERLHYLLVAGFNPFGTLGHQLGARLYMDFLRIEGEDNFLYFLPIKERKKLYNKWHEIDRKTSPEQNKATRAWLKAESVSGYRTDDKQHEFYQLLREYIQFKSPDSADLNRCKEDDCFKLDSDSKMQELARKVRGKVLQIFPEVSYVRVGGKDGVAYTVIHNKSYRTDAFAKEVNDRPDEDMKGDTLTVLKGLAGSYPNFFFDVDDIDAFVTACEEIKNRDDYERMIAMHGIRRTNPKFWEIADWFQDLHARSTPVESGLLDLSRYRNR
jgi:hypothetical protein